jgi:hypothetical protein
MFLLTKVKDNLLKIEGKLYKLKGLHLEIRKSVTDVNKVVKQDLQIKGLLKVSTKGQ